MIVDRKKIKILWIIDDLEYISSNCFQHQIKETFEEIFEIDYMDNRAIKNGKKIDKKYDKLFCSMRMRKVFEYIEFIKSCVGENRIFLYEQDPWEGFSDESPYKGYFDLVNKNLNCKFFITSNWWVDLVKGTGTEASFVKMGMLPKYCRTNPWEQRLVPIGFRGLPHEHRKDFYGRMKEIGIDIRFDTKRLNYSGFLNYLSAVKIYLHHDKRKFVINGKSYDYNGVWGKDFEPSCRGCFTLRNKEPEYEAYGMDKIPIIFTYENPEDAKNIIENIMSMSVLEKNKMIFESVNIIRNENNWKNSLAKELIESE